jgi:16S rRNA G1207 methylase RsmC
MEAPSPRPDAVVLDLGCGYGPIAVALACRRPDARVWAVDVNARARALTAHNADAAGAANVFVADPDDVPSDIQFDGIYSNPPVRIGKPALHALLSRWLPRLRDGGHAYLVVHKHLGSDSLAAWLAGSGHTVARMCSRLGYRVLDVSRDVATAHPTEADDVAGSGTADAGVAGRPPPTP